MLGIPREKRGLWLGHPADGSRTTDAYEDFDIEALEDVALGTDFTMSKLRKLRMTRLLAVEVRLTKVDLERTDARPLDKNKQKQKDDGGRYRDRTYDPTRVKEGQMEFR